MSTTASTLSPLLNRQLVAYAISAAAAAVAFSTPAEAQVIYTQTDLTLSGGSLNFDIDANGTADFNLLNNQLDLSYFIGGALEMRGNPSERNAVVGHKTSFGYLALPVPKGVAIGPGSPANFLKANRIITPLLAVAARDYSEGTNDWILKGQFANTTAKYLGFRFTGSGGPHYGWMRLSVVADPFQFPSITAKISGYAYEATPDTPIIAGDRGRGAAQSPHVQQSGATLGLLALGSEGQKRWR
jgi:hypothetical protein